MRAERRFRIDARCSSVRGRTTAWTAGSRPEPREHVVEERIAVPVVQRHLGRRPHDDEHALPLDPEIVQHGWVRSESVEVVLLLQPGIATHLGRTSSEAVEARLWDGVGNDDARRCATAEPVLCPRELVVEGVRRRDSERTRDHRQLVRGMRERDVEPSARARSAAERGADLPSSEPCRRRPRRRVPARRPRARSRGVTAARSSGRTHAW